PRRAVHVQSDVAVTAQAPFAGVQAHPYPHWTALGPGLLSQATLCDDGRLDRLGGRAENGEEGVAFGADLESVVRGNGLAEDGCVALQYPSEVRAKSLKQMRRALDVVKKTGDRTGREATAHGSNNAARRIVVVEPPSRNSP